MEELNLKSDVCQSLKEFAVPSAELVTLCSWLACLFRFQIFPSGVYYNHGVTKRQQT